ERHLQVAVLALEFVELTLEITGAAATAATAAAGTGLLEFGLEIGDELFEGCDLAIAAATASHRGSGATLGVAELVVEQTNLFVFATPLGLQAGHVYGASAALGLSQLFDEVLDLPIPVLDGAPHIRQRRLVLLHHLLHVGAIALEPFGLVVDLSQGHLQPLDVLA